MLAQIGTNLLVHRVARHHLRPVETSRRRHCWPGLITPRDTNNYEYLRVSTSIYEYLRVTGEVKLHAYMYVYCSCMAILTIVIALQVRFAFDNCSLVRFAFDTSYYSCRTPKIFVDVLRAACTESLTITAAKQRKGRCFLLSLSQP